MAKLEKLTIRGFKSIAKLERFSLGSINILIGANGAGKSNFVDFFRVLRAMVEEGLQARINQHGPADGYFFNGVQHTKKIEVDLVFGDNRYAFALAPTAEGKILVENEKTEYLKAGSPRVIGSGTLEASLKQKRNTPGLTARHGPNYYVYQSVSSWQVYHFHDTSMTAGMRRDVGVDQGKTLNPDASNLAAYLLQLKTNNATRYALLRNTIQRIAPYFDDFDLRVTEDFPEDTVRLTWKRKGTQYVFSPGHFSDGTIRFICMAAVLTQPHPPATVVFDEPELGLHPEALLVLAGLFRSAAARMQIIVATQSPILLNEFEPSDIITVDQVEGASVFNRLDDERLEAWLKEFSVGELWQKGNIRGGIQHG